MCQVRIQTGGTRRPKKSYRSSTAKSILSKLDGVSLLSKRSTLIQKNTTVQILSQNQTKAWTTQTLVWYFFVVRGSGQQNPRGHEYQTTTMSG